MTAHAFGIVPRSILIDPRLCHGARFLYALLATYADEAFECRPSAEELTQDSGCDGRTLRGLFAELEAQGYIERVPQHDAAGAPIASMIRLRMTWRTTDATS